jgi:hypothetical protein
MLLGATILNNVASVNNFTESTSTSFTEGDAVTVYLRLKDFNSNVSRYIPASGATLSVTFKNVNTANTVTKTATNPFASDTSIWAFTIAATDHVKGTLSLQLVLTEGATVTRGLVKDCVLVQPFNSAYV